MDREVRQIVVIFVSVFLCLLFGVLNVGLLDDESCKVLSQVVLVLL